MRRISGAAILDARLGKKYQVVQVIDGDRCELVITTITNTENIARVRQVIHNNNKCELKIMEVQ